MDRCLIFLWTFLTVFAQSVVSTNTSCPTWYYYSKENGKCECGVMLNCHNYGKKVEIANNLCATPLGQGGDYYIGHCLLLYSSKNGSRYYSEMPGNTSQLEQVMCSPHNRRGFLCGECIDGYGPAVFSPTMTCTSGLSKYAIPVFLLVQFIPTTLIFFLSPFVILKSLQAHSWGISFISFSHAIGFCFDERSAALLSPRMRRSHRTTPLRLSARAICLLLFPTGRLSPCARPLELPASQTTQS